MEDKIFEKLKEELPGIQKGILLKDYTTFKIGGPAKYFLIAETKEELAGAVKAAKKFKLPVFVLGGGSNLLVLEKGFKGLVIKVQNSEFRILNSKKIFVSAGLSLSELSDLAAENGFKGFEWSSGIPGTAGGAIFGNAQAFGDKISDSLEKVEVLNIKNLALKNLSKEQCKFSLKSSIFKKNKNLIIISAVFAPEKGDKEEIQQKTKKFLNYRKNNHPMSFPSAGSAFVNPEKKGEIIRAGSLIEKCGLKGKKIGGAQISEQHANFIVNLGNARAKDVLALIKLAQKKVKGKFGVLLKTEIQILK